MQQSIANVTPPMYLNDLHMNGGEGQKLSDDWLEIIFAKFYKGLNVPQGFFKREYYKLISLLHADDIDIEVVEKLDMKYDVIGPENVE